MGGKYVSVGPNLENCGTFWENGRFSRRIWPYWGNTTWADMAGLGSIGIISLNSQIKILFNDIKHYVAAKQKNL